MDSLDKQTLLAIADLASEFEFRKDIDWWYKSTKREISGEGLRQFAQFLKDQAKQMEDIKFTDEPCPGCKRHGDEKGYIVRQNCGECHGTGRRKQ